MRAGRFAFAADGCKQGTDNPELSRFHVQYRTFRETKAGPASAKDDPSVASYIYYAPRIALIRVAALPFSEVIMLRTHGANTIELVKLLLGPISSARCYR